MGYLRIILNLIITFSVSFPFLVIGLFGLYACWKSKHRSHIYCAIRSISTGSLLIGAGFFLWYYYVKVIKQLPTFPISDVLFVIAPYFLIHGLYFLHRVFSIGSKFIFVLIKILMWAAFFVAILLFFNLSFIISLSVIEIIQWYLITTDVIMIALTFSILLRAGGKVALGIRSILFSLLIFSFSDIFFVINSDENYYYSGDLPAILYMSGAVFLGIGIISVANHVLLNKRSSDK